MAFGSVTNDYKQHIWGAAAYGNQQTAMLGNPETSADFKNAMDDAEKTEEEESLKTFGFGSKGEDGALGSSITAMMGASQDMISQIQFSLLKNNTAATGNSVNSRISPIGFGA